MNWYLKVLRQYTDFNGRARRKEYWMFSLFNMIFYTIAFALDYSLGIIEETGGFAVLTVYILFIIIPRLALSVRRLHDTGKSGWMILINLIPVIGGIWYLILMLTDSNPGENKYGKNPKEEITI